MAAHHDTSGARPHPIVMHLEIVARMDPRTPKQLAAEDGISRQTWRSWTSGERSPGLDLLAIRAATLHHDIILTRRPKEIQ